ncbi:MAG: alpha/beta hydrolase [Ilumatobacteraceae bacterium]
MATEMVQVRGVDLAVHDAGESGLPFVWAHGLTSNGQHEDAMGMFRWGALDDIRLIRYDARGHGGSQGTLDPDDYAWPALAGDLLALMDRLGLERSAIGGASMGCATALFAALAAPERIERLVLVIPPTAWDTRAAQRDVYLAGAQLIADTGTAAMIERSRLQPPVGAFGVDGERLRDLGLTRLADFDPQLLATIMRGAASSNLPPPDVLSTVRQPALVLAWAGDPVHPVSTAARLGEILPTAEVHVADDLAAIAGWPELVHEFLVAR